MSQFQKHTSCAACGSTDANAVYDDNTSYCWSCTAWENLAESTPEEKRVEEVVHDTDFTFIDDLPFAGFRDRRITRKVSEFFNVKIALGPNGEPSHHYYPYTKGGTATVAYKERVIAGKKFSTRGDFKGVDLFGQSLFPPGGRKIVITEGELDAMAVSQGFFDKYDTFYPVVSIPNGASSLKSVLTNREYLRSFEEVVLFFDNDEPGRKAESEAARIIGADKVKIARGAQKDASDIYVAGGVKGIMDAVWNANPWCPAGVINSKDTWETYIAEKDAIYTPYAPFIQGLNDKIYGRRLGSITVFTSGTGSGKTSFLREDMLHLQRTTDSGIGVCSLEESVDESVRGFISLQLSKRVGIPGVVVTDEEEREAWEQTMGTGRYEILDHQGSVSDDTLLEKLEYMAVVCDYIYLDHITIAISEADGNINAAMDKFMSQLLKLAKRHNVWFGVVSHLRKSNQDQSSYEEGAAINEDSLKGSGSLKQIAAQIIALERDKNAEDIADRTRVKVRVLKDRFGGDTGTAGEYRYSFDDGRLYTVDRDTPSIIEGFEDVSQNVGLIINQRIHEDLKKVEP